MQTKRFSLASVLTVVADRALSVDEMRELLNFMAGELVYETATERTMEECRPYLIRQFPELADPALQTALGELTKRLETVKGNKAREPIIRDWIAELTSGAYGPAYPETMEVNPLPPGIHKSKDHLTETREFLGE